MSQFIKEYRLKQITPMLHFQYKQSGATLRASEVKPKLDKFLVECYRKEKEKKLPVDWCIKSDEADKDDNRIPLNYKMSIFCNEDSRYKINKDENTVIKTPMFFGDNKNVQMVIYKDFITLRITCMNSELRNFINDKIFDFFVLHNFGTRQSKGYGSFIVDNTSEEKIKSILDNYYPNRISFNSTAEYIDKLSRVDYIYKLMKTGINEPGRKIGQNIYQKDFYQKGFIMMDYFKADSNTNDKAYVKSTFKVGARHTDSEKRVDSTKVHYEFRRALLGLPLFLTFSHSHTKEKRKINLNDSVVISISDKENEIKRFPSPILIKIFDNGVYFLPNRNIDTCHIVNKEFKFSGDVMAGVNKSGRSDTIMIKTPKVFKCDEFLIAFAKEYNKQGYSKPRKLKNIDRLVINTRKGGE